ncbi:MAG: ferredoxin [Candidatus Heimdallarchaeota archaeon]
MAKVPRVNRYECAGCSLCVIALPEVFRLTPDGFSEVYSPRGASKEKIQKVMKDCPVNCCHWYEKAEKVN